MPKRRPPERALSAREGEVAALVAAGKSNRAIAQTLFLSERTVEQHVSSILNKLTLHSRVELMAAMLGPATSAAEADPGARIARRGLFSSSLRNRSARVIAKIRARIHRPPWFATSSATAAVRRRDSLARPLTETIGRDADIARIVAEVSASRVVTIAGPGGVGKSRVAIESGFALRSKHDLACAFVDLAASRTSDDVLRAVATASDVANPGSAFALDAIAATLDRHELVLILDNCEHVASEVAAVVRALVGGTPSAKFLITSRRPIGLPGERVIRLEALATAPADATREQMLAAPALLLFAARARDSSGFHLDDPSLVAATQLCAALDGLPLALEIAAGKTSALSVGQILAHSADRLRLLTADAAPVERQKSLHAVVDWSYQLLTPYEQALFRSVSVFRSPWTIENACAVLGSPDPLPVLEGLVSLADQSMIARADCDGQPGFRMLETLRLFAAERAAQSGESSVQRTPSFPTGF